MKMEMKVSEDIQDIMQKIAVLKQTINSVLPKSREQSLAITKIEEASHWIGHSISIQSLNEVK